MAISQIVYITSRQLCYLLNTKSEGLRKAFLKIFNVVGVILQSMWTYFTWANEVNSRVSIEELFEFLR